MEILPSELNEFQPVDLEQQWCLNDNLSAGAGIASNFLDEKNEITDDVGQHNVFSWRPISSIAFEAWRKLHLIQANTITDDVGQFWTRIPSTYSKMRRKLHLFQENRRSNGNQQNESSSRSFISSAAGRVINIFQRNRITDEVAQLNESTWKGFISYATGSIRNLSPKHYGFFLLLSGGVLSFLTKTCTTRFDSFQADKTTNTAEPVLTLEGAVDAFYPELVHITSYIICWIITFILILPLELVRQIFSVLLWLCSTGIYVVELVKKTSASKIHVACAHSFKLPVFWFMIVLAFGYAFIVGLIVFLIVFLSFKFIHKGNPRQVEVGLTGAMSLI